MTLPYLATARLNAVPLSKHIDTPEQPKPQFRTQEEYAAAMMADAKKVNAGWDFERKPKADTQGKEIPPAPIVNLIKARPGITTSEIGAELGIAKSTLSAKMCALENQGFVKSVSKSRGAKKRGGAVRHFYFIKPWTPYKRENVQRNHEKPKQPVQEVIDFIRRHPRCTSFDIANRFGISRKSANGKIRNARNWVNIQSKAQTGPLPALYWIEE